MANLGEKRQGSYGTSPPKWQDVKFSVSGRNSLEFLDLIEEDLQTVQPKPRKLSKTTTGVVMATVPTVTPNDDAESMFSQDTAGLVERISMLEAELTLDEIEADAKVARAKQAEEDANAMDALVKVHRTREALERAKAESDRRSQRSTRSSGSNVASSPSTKAPSTAFAPSTASTATDSPKVSDSPVQPIPSPTPPVDQPEVKEKRTLDTPSPPRKKTKDANGCQYECQWCDGDKKNQCCGEHVPGEENVVHMCEECTKGIEFKSPTPPRTPLPSPPPSAERDKGRPNVPPINIEAAQRVAGTREEDPRYLEKVLENEKQKLDIRNL